MDIFKYCKCSSSYLNKKSIQTNSGANNIIFVIMHLRIYILYILTIFTFSFSILYGNISNLNVLFITTLFVQYE